MPLARVSTKRGAILYDPARIELPDPLDFDAESLARAGRIRAEASGRGQVFFCEPRGPHAAGEQWVLRHYRRGGLVRHLLADRYLFRSERSTRAFAECTLLAELTEANLPVPAPVAARFERRGLTYAADLITVAIPAATTLAELVVTAAGEPLDPVLMAAIGRVVRRLHDAGVWHADLNAHNLLADRQGRAFVIDFDRARRRPPGAWHEANLRRLERSLAKVCAAAGLGFPAADARALRAGYEGV